MKKYFNGYNVLNVFLILAVLVGDVLFMNYGTILIKSIASLFFVLLGVLNLIYAFKQKTDNKKFCILMLTGLCFAMLGDIVLELYFIFGALLFAVGHMFYFVAYCALVKFVWKDLIYACCIFVPTSLFILFAPIFNFGGVLMQIVCVFYALIISCMVGKAIANYVKEKSLTHLILMIGSLLFMFSDFILLLNMFSEISKPFSFLCLATYYPAECMLAIAINAKNLFRKSKEK